MEKKLSDRLGPAELPKLFDISGWILFLGETGSPYMFTAFYLSFQSFLCIGTPGF